MSEDILFVMVLYLRARARGGHPQVALGRGGASQAPHAVEGAAQAPSWKRRDEAQGGELSLSGQEVRPAGVHRCLGIGQLARLCVRFRHVRRYSRRELV